MAVLPKESPWTGSGDDAESRCCSDCSDQLREERGRMRSVVMEVLDRLRLEEKMADEEKRRAEEEMKAVMAKLATLQKSLLSEQLRVKKLLNSKDKLIRNLTKENRKLKQKMSKFVSLEMSSCSSSETGREALTSTSSAESTDSQTEQASSTLHGQSELMISPDDKNHHQNNDASAAQHHPGETKEEYNNNSVTGEQGEASQYVIVADNLRQPKLVVLDNAGDTGDTTNDNVDNKVAPTPTNDRSSLQLTQTRAALRQMTNHRSATKPSDIKHRDRVQREHKTLLSYWSDSFL